MPFLLDRKIIQLGPSRAITVPEGWSKLLPEQKVSLMLDQAGIIYPRGMPKEEVEKHIQELLKVLKEGGRKKGETV